MKSQIRRICLCVFFLCPCVLVSIETFAKEKTLPKWEVGFLMAGQYANEYRGSAKLNSNVVAAPFVYYRGDIVKVDRGGARAEFISADRFELNLSGEVALSGKETKSESRQGMPDLNTVFELGPSMNFNLTGKGFSEGIILNVPFRAAIELDGFNANYLGLTFNPKLTYLPVKTLFGWRSKIQLGAMYGAKDYHGYYYDVAAEYVTSQRQAYSAGSGFSGTYFKVSTKKRMGSVFVGASLRFDDLSDAVFANSPLVEQEQYYSLSLAVAYIFWNSN